MGSISATFMRLRIAIEQSNEEEAIRQVGSVCACPDFSPAMLEVFCQEAVKAGAWAVAKEALVRLLDNMGSKAQQLQRSELTEATILRALIQCMVAHAKATQTRSECHGELGEYFMLVANRWGEGRLPSNAYAVQVSVLSLSLHVAAPRLVCPLSAL